MIHHFATWLNDTSLSSAFKTAGWLVPVSQSVHIIAIGIVLSAFVMLTMRTTGLSSRGVGISLLNRRFLPWVWVSIVVLAVTGVIQIIAEPGRAMPNPYFQAKMAFLVVVIALLWRFQSAVRRDPALWDSREIFPARIRGVFALLLLLTIAIIFCGRWIAYSDTPQF